MVLAYRLVTSNVLVSEGHNQSGGTPHQNDVKPRQGKPVSTDCTTGGDLFVSPQPWLRLVMAVLSFSKDHDHVT